jgi:hypothetical protein
MGECSKQELSINHHLLTRTTLNHGVQCLVTVFRNCFIESRSLKRKRQRRGRFLVRHDSPTIRLYPPEHPSIASHLYGLILHTYKTLPLLLLLQRLPSQARNQIHPLGTKIQWLQALPQQLRC